jgi:amidohydrolase
MAASDRFEIIVTGKQAHGSSPWRGVDPIVVGAQIVSSLQTIVSRSVDITRLPAVVTVGQFQSGVRNNIIPETARLVGTIRTFDAAMQDDIHARVKRIAGSIAEGAGATAQVTIVKGPPVVSNEAALTKRMLPTLERVAPGKVKESELITGARTSRSSRSRRRACSSSWASRHPSRPALRPQTTRRCSLWMRRRCRQECARLRISPWTT